MMSSNLPRYSFVEHTVLEVEGFRVVDATASGDRAHDDLVWLGYGGMDGRWLTPAEALTVAEGINSVVKSHLARRSK